VKGEKDFRKDPDHASVLIQNWKKGQNTSKSAGAES